MKIDTLKNFITKRNIKLSFQIKAFLLCGLIAALIVLPDIIYSNGCFALSFDFNAQIIPFGMLMNSAIKNGEIWSCGIDLGGNLLESFAYYGIGSVFNWISFLFPAAVYPYVIGWIFILKFAVAGYTSALWMKRYVHNQDCILIGAMLYAFSGAQLTNMVFFLFMDVIALFPLMLYAVDALIIENRRGLLILASTVNLMCNPICFFGSVCFTGLYYFFRFLIPNLRVKYQTECIMSCFFEGGVSCLLGSIIAVPAVLSMLHSSRTALKISPDSWLTMTTKDWLTVFSAWFLPAESMDSHSVELAFSWGSWAAYLPLFGVTFTMGYLIAKQDWLRRLLISCAVMSMVPVLNSVFIAFSPDRYGRWLFMATLMMALATAKICENLQEYKKPVKIGAILSLILVIAYGLIVFFVPWDDDGNSLVRRKYVFFFGIFIAIAGILTCLMFVCKSRKISGRTLKSVTAVFCTVLLAVSVYDYQSGELDNTNIDFHGFSGSYAKNVCVYLTEIPMQLNQEVLPYRYYFDEGIGYTYYNLSMTNNLPSINSFTSTPHTSVTEFYNLLGTGRGNNMTRPGPVGTNELLGVKYIVTREQRTDLSLLESWENDLGQTLYIYEDSYAIPMGTVYDSYITKSEYESTNVEARALIMLHTLVVDDADETQISECLKHDADYAVITTEDQELVFQQARKGIVKSFTQEKNGFSSVVEAEDNLFAFYSVPYDQYWQVTVNGKIVETYNINGLTAIPLTDGENNVEFIYVYAPLKWVVKMTFLGIVMSILYMIYGYFIEKTKGYCKNA